MKNLYLAYVIDGDNLLTVNNHTPDETKPALPHLFQLKDTSSFKLSDLIYQHQGITRLQLSDESASIYFAITKDIAIELDLIIPFNFNCFKDKKNKTYSWQSFRSFLSYANQEELSLFSQAIQRIRWQKDHQFCCKCGSSTSSHSFLPAMICNSCDYYQYTQIQPCVITAILKTSSTSNPQILLANHHNQFSDSEPQYGLIAGFVEVGESLEQAVHREVFEEVGLSVTDLQYFYSQPWPYPSNLMVGYVSFYQDGDIRLQEEELADAQFFDFNNLPKIPPHGSISRNLIEHVIKKYS